MFVTSVAIWLPACATMEPKPNVATVNPAPQVSPVVVAASKPAERQLKRKVAIARFSNETRQGQSFFLDQNRDWVGKQAMDILSAKLTSTDKFVLLERADLDKITQELKVGSLENLHIPADQLIVGSVSEFGRKTVSDVGLFSRVKKQVAFAKVNVRLVDVQTGRIVYSAEGEGEAFSEAGSIFGVGARADYDSTLNDKAIDAAIGKLVNNIMENLLDKPWRAYLLSYQNGAYVMSGGKSQGIRPGDRFAVYRRGPLVKNPQTGMMLELPATKLATVQVTEVLGTDVSNEVSLGSVTEGALPVENFGDLYVQEARVGR